MEWFELLPPPLHSPLSLMYLSTVHLLYAQVRSKGKAYSLPLEEILNIEFSVLNRTKSLQLLHQIFSSIETISSFQSKTTTTGSRETQRKELLDLMKRIVIDYHQLISFLNHTMTTEYERSSSSPLHSSTSSQHLRVRSLGLLLSGFYLPQLFDWLTSEIFTSPSEFGSGSARLLIVQSEFMFQNRYQFFQSDFFNFLHPNPFLHIPSSSSSIVEDAGSVNMTSIPVATFLHINTPTNTNRANTSGPQSPSLVRPISNHKPMKGKESFLSPMMRERLLDFYTGNRGEGKGVIEYDVLLSVLVDVMTSKRIVVNPPPSDWKTEIWIKKRFSSS
jgi:hypothetical protein